MTSANVSDVPILLNFGQTQVQSAAKSENSSLDFQNVMFQNVTVSDLPTASPKDEITSDVNMTTDRSAQDFSTAKRIPQAEDDKSASLQGKDITTEKKAIEEFANEVSEVLKEELDVTDEEIVAAMENLGLCYMDLLNPNNLTKLVSELSTDDSIQLLVTNTVGNILDQVQNLGVDLLSTVEMTPVELKEVELFDAGIAPVVMEENPLETVDVTIEVPLNQPSVEASNVEVASQNVEIKASEDESMISEIIPQKAEETTTPVTVRYEENVDETNDLAEEPEAGVQNLVSNTGESSRENNDSKQNLFDGSNPTNRTNREVPSQNVENSVGPTFQNTVTTVQTESEVVTTYTTTSIDTQDVIQQIVNNAKVTISNQVTSMEMELNPAHLGRMILNVAENDGKVTAHITLQNEAVRHAMETQMSVLRENLNQQGIKVEAVEVSVGTHEFERNLEEGQQMQQEANERGQEAARQTRRSNINLNNLDELQGLMTEEEALVASMMRDAGNSINFTA